MSALDRAAEPKKCFTRRDFVMELRSGGMESLLQRGRTVLSLLANTQQSGVVLNRDYLHLSRSLFAAAGSFGSLYESTPRRFMLRDLARSLLRLPWLAVGETPKHRLSHWRRRVMRFVPTRQGPQPQMPQKASPRPRSAAA